MSHAARSERPIRRWISTVRPLCLPLAASRSTRSGDEPGQHRVLGGDPALALALHPARHVLVDARGAQHTGPAERHEHAAGGHLGVVALERERAQLVGVRGRRAVSMGVVVTGVSASGHAFGCGRARGRAGGAPRSANQSVSPLDRKRCSPGAPRRRRSRPSATRARARGDERRLVGAERRASPPGPSRRRSRGRGTGSACSRAAACRRRAAFTGASRRSARIVISSPLDWPRSTNSTKPGHAARRELDRRSPVARDGALVRAGRRSCRRCRSRRPGRCASPAPAPARPARSTSITGTGRSSREVVERGGRRGVAGDDDDLGVEVLDEAPRELVGVRRAPRRAASARTGSGRCRRCRRGPRPAAGR